MQEKMKIGIIGLGMVGGPIKRYFEETCNYTRGDSLFLYDIDPQKNYDDDINNADIIFVSVPTPRTEKGHADTSALSDVFNLINGEKIVVIKSTVPPGTTEHFQKQYPKHRVLFSPEFLTEKQAWEDFIKPDRQIVGFTEKSMDAAHAVLSLLPKAPFMSPWGVGTYKPTRITATEAEMIKYAGNVYFARKITFANTLAKACEALADSHDINYDNIRMAMSADHRIGDSHLDVTHGGYRGFGGYCLPKDLSAFAAFLHEKGLHDCADLLDKDWEFNEKMLADQGLTIKQVSVHNKMNE